MTNLGCLCTAVWAPPALTNRTRGNAAAARALFGPGFAAAAAGGKPFANGSGVITGGRCAAVAAEDGSTAGGAWCYTVEKTCANNPKASDLPRFERDFDYCG